MKHYLGIDCGSVSVKIAIINEQYEILYEQYKRSNGSPVRTLQKLLTEYAIRKHLHKIVSFSGIFVTGSGRFLIEKLLGAFPCNEISAHGKAAGYFYPKAQSIIEIGGQDSKLIFLESDGQISRIADSQMNDVCAAGTGSFLDQQAYRMGIDSIELSSRSLDSNNPSKISGRCSVFAKTDMIHLQQDAVPKEDISYGLCMAVVRTYIENLAKGRKIKAPILFQGGVANNQGVIRAFKEILKLSDDQIIVPNHFDTMGAIGAVIYGLENHLEREISTAGLSDLLNVKHDNTQKQSSLSPLSTELIETLEENFAPCTQEVYLGIDVGSVSVKMAVLNDQGHLCFKYYTNNESDPLAALTTCFHEFKEQFSQFSNSPKILGVGVTGSGRDYIGRCIGADVVKNEITAQAKGCQYLAPNTEVIIEIGGQDSKYIRMNHGYVVDFVMNKTCAAGTGSFLTEQSDRLSVSIEDFSQLAFASVSPIDVGSRCTVFMETDCIHHQQNGASKEDIIAGLSYSIAHNYLDKVAYNKPFIGNISIQGGIASNLSVVSALSMVLNEKITVVPHHEVSGAVGIALLAKEASNGQSRFSGFDFETKIEKKQQITCKDCSNHCMLQLTKFRDGSRTITGSICDKFEQSERDITACIPNVFAQRKELLEQTAAISTKKRKKIGIPKFLLFYELYPLWRNFFEELGFEVVVSDTISKEIYQKSLGKIPVDTCYPIRCTYSIVENLMAKGVDYVYLPYISNMREDNYQTHHSHNCQYVQHIPDLITSAFNNIPVLKHTMAFKDSDSIVLQSFIGLGNQLNKSKEEVIKAYETGMLALKEFKESCIHIGSQALVELGKFKKAFVLIGHSYVLHEEFFNMNLVQRLMKMGMPTISADMLPLKTAIKKASTVDLHWKTNNHAVNAIDFIDQYNQTHDNMLLPIFITQFGCAADSMLTPYLKDLLGENPWLEIEVDEHNSITGVLTRCEAFWDSVLTKKDVLNTTFNNLSTINFETTKLNKIKSQHKTLFVYPICESVSVFPPVFKKHGMKSEMMKETDDFSNALGKKYSNEKHCRTYQVMIGDYLALTQKRQEFFDKQAAILMFDYDGACRLSLFKSLHHKVLVESGVPELDIFSLLIDDPLEWVSHFGLTIAVDLWKSMLCLDYLHRYAVEMRPLELIKGDTNKAYQEAKEDFFQCIQNGTIVRGFKAAMNKIQHISKQKKDVYTVGVTGDGFTRVHKYGMDPIFEKVESMGGQVLLPPSWNDFINFGSYKRSETLAKNQRHVISLANRAASAVLDYFKKEIQRIAEKYSDHFKEPTIQEITAYSQKYVNCEINPVIPSMFIGKTVDFVLNDQVDGIINAYGFNCCLGKITTACINKFRYEESLVPMFTFIDDGLKQTNTLTRVEAFMEQVKQYHHIKMPEVSHA
ncbi:2-hydroxyglutaryl-CoA dehydratase activator [Clostridia bacterium]|nr:2-hydroxyglutaryl-CoA dehydratase activator [Clostridia bacterium]